MASFQKIVLIGAIILFIVLVIGITYVMINSKSTQAWPPLIGDCPDYWVDMSGNGAQCVNVKNLGTCNQNPGSGGHSVMDFTQAPFVGSNGLCSKYTWATGCGITWDGITDGVNNPCIIKKPST
jgi:hypothetical protein